MNSPLTNQYLRDMVVGALKADHGIVNVRTEFIDDMVQIDILETEERICIHVDLLDNVDWNEVTDWQA